MPRALHRSHEPSACEGVATGVGSVALRAAETDKSVIPADRSADVMIDPLHPMHQDLLARISGARVMDTKLPRPQRLAIAFYGSVAGWALVWLSAQLVASLL